MKNFTTLEDVYNQVLNLENVKTLNEFNEQKPLIKITANAVLKFYMDELDAVFNEKFKEISKITNVEQKNKLLKELILEIFKSKINSISTDENISIEVPDVSEKDIEFIRTNEDQIFNKAKEYENE